MGARKRLGDLLIEEGLIDEQQLGSALGSQRQWGGRLGTVLVKHGFITEQQLIEFLSRRMGIPPVDFATVEIDRRALSALPEALARQHNVVPVAVRADGSKERLLLANSILVNVGYFRRRKKIYHLNI